MDYLVLMEPIATDYTGFVWVPFLDMPGASSTIPKSSLLMVLNRDFAGNAVNQFFRCFFTPFGA